MSCERKKQLFDRFGDPINSCSKGFDDFLEHWEKKHGKTKSWREKQDIKENFYDDFLHNKNQSVRAYLKEIEEPLPPMGLEKKLIEMKKRK